MKIWHQYPFVRLVFPFLAGIATAIYFNFPLLFSLLPVIILLTIVYGLFVFVLSKKLSYSWRWLNGFFIYLILFLAGYEITRLNTASLNPGNISHFSIRQSALLVQVCEPVTERPNSYKIVAKAIMVKDSLNWKPVSGMIMLYFEKDSAVSRIMYGDQLIIQTTLNGINPPMNPGEFNYKRYLSNRGIYNQGFVKANGWEILASNKGNSIMALSLKVRRNFLHILESNNIKGDEFAVASALLVGCTDYLDAGQMKEYAGSGAIHILSVSGLHVGIIYLFLNTVLIFLNKKRFTRIIKVLLMILLIWLYALITGFSPSVLRASLMFSFIIFGELLTRKVNTYNTLTGSALLLLLISPYLITDVGFQLSYIAVFGIVWLYRPVCNLYIPSNRILRIIWQTSAISIAATIVTFPLTIFYFRQFPNLFLITNLIAVPLSTIIIYFGIAVLAFSPVQVISAFFAMLMSKMIWLLNYSIRFIEGQSFAVAKEININTIEMVLLFLIVISISTFFLVKTRSYFYIAFVAIVLFTVSTTIRHLNNQFRKKIVAFSINKSTAIDFIDGKKGILLLDSILVNDENKINYHIQNNRIIAGVNLHEGLFLIEQNLRNDHLYKNGKFMQFYNKSLILIDPDFEFRHNQQKFRTNFLLLSHDPAITISELTATFDFELIIFDNSNSFWNTNQWIKECEQSGIDFYSIRENGAWEYRI
jgi:competence protein ComEC